MFSKKDKEVQRLTERVTQLETEGAALLKAQDYMMTSLLTMAKSAEEQVLMLTHVVNTLKWNVDETSAIKVRLDKNWKTINYTGKN